MPDVLSIVFPVSGVEVNILMPPLVALCIAFMASLGGLSGAFLILPFMISALGYAGPSATATNFVYNMAAIPPGVYRFWRERRMLWPLVWVFTLGTLPGLVGGYYLRVTVFPDPERFRLLVGGVLLYMGIKLFRELMNKSRPKAAPRPITDSRLSAGEARFSTGESGEYSFRTAPLFVLSLAVGVIGGAYGIGGGAIIVPYLVAVAGLPVYAVAGAALLGTLITSIAGAGFYMFMPSPQGIYTGPDWALGLLFGAGGALGVYLGARAQRYVPERLIKAILFVIITAIAIKYLWGITKFI